jgi:hypothetical protein
LFEVDDLAVVEGELMKISAGCFDAAGAGCAADVHRVEAGCVDQALDRRRGGLVVGGVEEDRPARLMVCRSSECFGAERPRCLDVVGASRE